MRYARFDQGVETRLGVVSDGRIQPLRVSSLQQVIDGAAIEPDGGSLDLAEVHLRAPLRPGKVIAVGLNYMDHCREQGIQPPSEPLLFSKFPTSVIGPGEEVRWPRGLTTQADYEVELGVIIGQTLRGIREDDALDAVFGYTCVNDVTARDLQHGDGQWTRAKGMDSFCPIGPFVVSTDEVPDVQNLKLVCRVNGQVMQDSSTGEMVFPVKKLLAHISQAITLEPGDLVLTGTPHGVGMYHDPPVYLKPGDIMEVEVGDFGVLRNPVGEELIF
ncbi:MAG: fumarylacetoacetate hydrolase family protein [Chloroflexi bacterium]|nr:fumarylacetoacetate hydrolase family protein [Chloroflexota bacterium]